MKISYSPQRRQLQAAVITMSVLFGVTASKGGEVDKVIDSSVAMQPVFILCPHKTGYSAWLLSLEVDKDNPEAVKALCLDSLTNINSIDLQYEEIIAAAQTDSMTPRKRLDRLPIEKFATGSLNVRKNNALQVSVIPVGKDFQLNLKMRVGAADYFTLGGKERAKRSVVLHYDPAGKCWSACANHLEDAEGTVVVQKGFEPMYGVYFPVSFTGIYRVVGVFKTGDFAILMDR